MTTTLPPEIEAAIDELPYCTTAEDVGLRTAITRALADAREAGRREVSALAARDVEDAIAAVASGGIRYVPELRASIAADKARALSTMRPALSAEEAGRLIEAHAIAAVLNPSVTDDPIAYEQEATARDALLAALTGAGGGR
jgi:hypothetical protein